MNRKLSISFLVVSMLLYAGAVVQRPGLAAPTHVPSSADVETFKVNWNISVNHYKDSSGGDFVDWEKEEISIAGGATVRAPRDFGPSQALPFQLTETDDYEHVSSGPCGSYHATSSIQDSQRYTGGPDPFWVNPYVWLLTTPQGNQWYMTNPLYSSPWDIAPDNSMRVFHYHRVEDQRNWCPGGSNDHQEWDFQLEPLIPPPPGPNGWAAFNVLYSNDGVTFALDLSYEADPWTHVDYHVSVAGTGCPATALAPAAEQGPSSSVCGCASRPLGEVIDAGNRIVTTLDVSRGDGALLAPLGPFDIGPNGRWPLDYVVTCMGRKVSNAELKISVKPKQGSGSHGHGDASRPRGYLNGVKITQAQPNIKITTDAHGTATVQFEPGRDLQDELWGISGDYEVTAQSTRFPSAKIEDVVRVGVPNLGVLIPGPNYVLAPSKSHKGNSTLYGTSATLNAVKQLANDFRTIQDAHNQVLTQTGKTPWPIAQVIAGDISLRSGGLLDLQNSWVPPHKGHDYGQDVRLDYKIPPSLMSLAGKQGLAWLEHIFEMSGTKYGQWYASDGKRNLRVGSLASASVEATQATGGPDLTTVAFVSDPEDRYTAGAGQTVTYTIGVENLAADSPAYGVVLTATLPTGLSFVRAIPAPTRLVSGDQPVWDLGTLTAEGIPQVFDVVGQIGAGVAPGTVLTITAEAGLSEADVNPADNQAESFGLEVQPSGADLITYSEIEASAMIPGQLVTFTVGASNGGNVSAAASALTLTLPASVTLVSAIPAPYSVGPDRVSWQLGDITVNALAEVTMTAYLHPALGATVLLSPTEEGGDVLTYTLQVSTVTPDFDPSNNVQDVVMPLEFAGPDLLAKLTVATASGSAVTAGQDITYTVFYGNYGNQTAPTTTLTLSLWSGMQLVNAEPAPGRTITSSTFLGGVLGWDMGDLPVGDQGEIRVRVHVVQIPSEGNMVLAVVRSNEVDVQPTDNVDVRIESSKSYAVYLPLVMASAHGGPAPTATATPTPTATVGTPPPPPPGLGPRRFPAVMTATPATP